MNYIDGAGSKINPKLDTECMLSMHDVFCHVLWISCYKYGVFGKFYKYPYCVLCNPGVFLQVRLD
jgi:hypothetical protein